MDLTNSGLLAVTGEVTVAVEALAVADIILSFKSNLDKIRVVVDGRLELR
jgi:hypothetical protein